MEFNPYQLQSPSNNQLIRLTHREKSTLLPQAISNGKGSENGEGKNKRSQFENGYTTQQFFTRYARSEYLLAGSVTVNLSMSIVYFQMSVDQDPLAQWILYMGLVFQFFCSNPNYISLVLVLVINCLAFNQYKRHQNHHFEIKKQKEILIYTLLLLVKPYPFLEECKITFRNELRQETHQINHILCLLSFLQVFLIIPGIFIKSKFQSIRSQRISDMYGFRPTYIYGIKCWFKQNSVYAVMVAFFFWFIFCVMGYRIAQYKNNAILRSFENSVWLTFITMSTAGLGDIYPITNVGFVISTITMYSGVMMVSIAVVLLTNTFKLNSRQKRALKILKTLKEKGDLRFVASEYIRQSMWRLWRNRKNREFGVEAAASLKERKLREHFRSLRIQVRSINFESNLREEFNHNFSQICGYMENLKENQDRMIHFLQFGK